MPTTEYLYTIPGGWQPVATPRLPATAPSPGEALVALGYRWLAESHHADGGVGHFFLWQRRTPDPAWPRYAADCIQWNDGVVVWLPDLPTLWEWVRLYGPVAVVLRRSWANDEDDEDDDDEDDKDEDPAPRCPDWGEPMTLCRVIPLSVVLGNEATECDVEHGGEHV
jgi:hypothetical protein